MVKILQAVRRIIEIAMCIHAFEVVDKKPLNNGLVVRKMKCRFCGKEYHDLW